MAEIKTTHKFDCTQEELFHIITDYGNYSDFLNEIKSCEVLKEVGGRQLVEYKISAIKSFTYRLWMEEDWDEFKVSWTFDSGDLFKANNGFWSLKNLGNQCEATYSVDAKVKMFIPGTVLKTLINVNLPAMMKSYEKRLTEVSYE
jgi:coenzyme Q-binding protein COQ10